MDSLPHRQFTDVASIYDDLMSVVPYSHWVDYVEDLWLHYQVQPRLVLDLACGTGNVAMEIQRRGHRVVGVDLSQSMIDRARSKSDATSVWERQDMRRLDLPWRFDACVCLFDSLNYLLEDGDLQSAFASVALHLQPGGLFIFDMNSIRALEAGMFNQKGTGRDPSLTYVWESAYDPRTRLCTVEMEFTITEVDGARKFHETHVQRGYTLAEISSCLLDSGLEELAIYDAFSFREPRARSDRYHVVARARST